MVGHVLYGVFLLILLFLVLSNWNAATSLIGTSGNVIDGYTRTLQGRK